MEAVRHNASVTADVIAVIKEDMERNVLNMIFADMLASPQQPIVPVLHSNARCCLLATACDMVHQRQKWYM